MKILSELINLFEKNVLGCESYAKKRGVEVGENCKIATTSFGSEPYLISIGNHVQITNGVKFFTHGAAWVFREEMPDFDVFGKIKVGNNVYIGNNALIMPGVTIGNNVIIGAGSVVTKSVENDNIIAGNPATVIGNVQDLKERLSAFNLKSKGMTFQKKKEFLLSQPKERFLRK